MTNFSMPNGDQLNSLARELPKESFLGPLTVADVWSANAKGDPVLGVEGGAVLKSTLVEKFGQDMADQFETKYLRTRRGLDTDTWIPSFSKP